MRKLLTLILLAACACVVAVADDRTTYADGSRPKVLINWDSFEDQGFPSSWKIPFTNVVINGYTRMNRVLGVDVRPQFWGYTTKTDSDPGEIVISANEKHADSNRLASTFGWFPDRLKIVFHRKRGSDLTPWNWTPFWPNNGEYSMYAVFMHELGHCLGLDHSGPTKNIMGSYTWTSHHGPWSGDQADTRALYSFRNANRLRQLATYNGGQSWSTLSNDITSFGAPWGRTTNRIAAAGNSSNANYLIGWATPDNFLTWARGDGVAFDTADWYYYTQHPRPRYGSDMVSDNGNNWMWVVVDGRNDDNRVRVIRSTDNGDSWFYTGFPQATTSSTPGIAFTRIEGQRVWIVLWVNYDESDRDNTGYIYGSVSFNDGATWSQPHAVDSWYRVHDGVGVAADDNGNVRVTFVWGGESGMWAYGQNKVRSFSADVAADGTVSRGGLCFPELHSRIAPDFTWHSDSGQFVQGLREQDFNTSLDSLRGTVTQCPGSFLHISGSTTHVAPGLARNPAWHVPGVGNEVVMWFARE